MPYPPAFLKVTPASPLKGSLYGRASGGYRPLVSHNGPKNQNTRGSGGGSPCLLSPFLCVKKGGAGQTRFCRACWSLSAHIKRCPNEKGYPMRGHVLSPRGERTQKKSGASPPGPRRICRFSLHKNRRVRHLLNRRSYNKGARGPRSLGGHHFYGFCDQYNSGIPDLLAVIKP